MPRPHLLFQSLLVFTVGFLPVFGFAQLVSSAARLHEKADSVYARGDEEAAVQAYLEASQQYLLEEKWQAYVGLEIQLFYLLGDLVESGKALKRAKSIAVEKMDSMGVHWGQIHDSEARLMLFGKQDYDSARYFFSLALPHFQHVKATTAEVSVHNSLAEIAIIQQNWEEAQHHLQEGLALAQQAPEDTELLADTYRLYGLYANEVGDYELVLQSFDKARGLSQDPFTLSVIYIGLGDFYKKKKDWDRASQMYQKAIDIAPLEYIASAYCDLSEVYTRKKEYQSAEKAALTYLKVLESTGNESSGEWIRVLNRLGIIFIEKGEPANALQYLQQAEALSQAHPSLSQKASTLHNISYAHRMRQDDDQARTYLLMSIQGYEEAYGTRHINIAKEYRHLGTIHARLGEHEAALAHYQEAFKILSQEFEPKDILETPESDGGDSPLDFVKTLRDKGLSLEANARESQDSLVYLNAALATYQTAATYLSQMEGSAYSGIWEDLQQDTFALFARGIELAKHLGEGSGDQRYQEIGESLAKQQKQLKEQDQAQRQKNQLLADLPDTLRQKWIDLELEQSFYRELIQQEKRNGETADTAKLERWEQAHLQVRKQWEDLKSQISKDFPALSRLID